MTTLKEVFDLFCSKDSMRIALLNPFVIGEKTYATDGYRLVRCDSSKIDFEFENKATPPQADKVIPEINTSEVIDIDSIDWVSLMNKDETIGDGNDIECGNCKGEGTCDDSVYYKSKFYNYEYDCPVCEGSGYEEEEMLIPTGNKTFGQFDMIKFKETYFYATKFYTLKKVKDLIGGNVELLSYNENNRGILFRIEFLEILIMPCLNNSEDNIVATIN